VQRVVLGPGEGRARAVPDAPMNTLPALIVGAIYTAVMLWAVWNLVKLRSELDAALVRLYMEKQKRREAEAKITKTELRVMDFAAKMSPLIAKTDWMTGRWKGQFDTLVSLENQRNRDVEIARKALFEIPMIKRNPLNPTPYKPKDAEK
jgi:hypothetical protein